MSLEIDIYHFLIFSGIRIDEKHVNQIDNYSSLNKLPQELNSWQEFYEAYNDFERDCLKCRITKEFFNIESITNFLRVCMWFNKHYRNE